ncbi:hypothetical protein ACFL6U_29875 [Planctomycetota bacterium]
MISNQKEFIGNYTINLRPGNVLGAIAAILLIFTPMLNPYVAVGLGIALLILMGFCHFSVIKRNNRSKKT